VASVTLAARVVAVRDAAAADLDRIAAIWNHEVRRTDTTTDTEPRDAAALAKWFARHSAPYPIVVAATGDALFAFGALAPYRPKPAFARTVEDSVYVERDHRGAGLGGVILAELIRRASVHGHRSMLARITSANAASIRLHARHGFRVVGVEREVALKHDRWLDVTIMQRPL
jgi:L-amino acid N-acyltransferase YncA